MTNKEAIVRLNDMQSRCENGYDAEAINLAGNALMAIDAIILEYDKDEYIEYLEINIRNILEVFGYIKEEEENE